MSSAQEKEFREYARHPLLDLVVCNDWPAMQRLIAPEYKNLTGRDLNVHMIFASANEIERDHGLMGARGDIPGQGIARTERLRSGSLKSYARFYEGVFHELEHLDDQVSGFEMFASIMEEAGFLFSDHSNYDQLYALWQLNHPQELVPIDRYFYMERMIIESRAELFALTLSDNVFAGHPVARAIAAKVRYELLASAELYAGGNKGFDVYFDRNILALVAIARFGSTQKAWEFLSASVSDVGNLALSTLEDIHNHGFSEAIGNPVNQAFRKSHALRPYNVQFEWSGTEDELNSIAHPSHDMYQRFAFCARPDSFEQAVVALKNMLL